eukprot:gene7012-8362_t
MFMIVRKEYAVQKIFVDKEGQQLGNPGTFVNIYVAKNLHHGDIFTQWFQVATPPKLGYDKEEELDVEKMWVIWDKDASGELDAREFKDVLMDLGVGEDNPEEVAEVYRQVDTDGSGFISIDEFKHWWFSKRFS